MSEYATNRRLLVVVVSGLSLTACYQDAPTGNLQPETDGGPAGKRDLDADDADTNDADANDADTGNPCELDPFRDDCDPPIDPCTRIEPTGAVLVTTLDSRSGSPISTFSAGLVVDQLVRFIAVDASDAIWVGRGDVGSATHHLSPFDEVAKFAPSGTGLLTVKGPMRMPRAAAVDSAGNVYVAGVPDGGSLSAEQIYKYDPSGVFLMSFGELTSPALGASYMALEFAPGDRLFATTNNSHAAILEFTTAGAQVNTKGTFDGDHRHGNGLSLSPDGMTLWNYQRTALDINHLPPTESFIVAYDLDLTVRSSFGLDALGLRGQILWGLDTLGNGNLVARTRSRILEISPTGRLVREIDFSSIDEGRSLRRGFGVDNSGNFLVSHSCFTDCNRNGIPDEHDISEDPSLDENLNGQLDECETLLSF